MLCGRSGRCVVLFVKKKCCPLSHGDVVYCQSGKGAVLAAMRTAVLSAGIVAVLSGRDAVLYSVRVISRPLGRGYSYAVRKRLYLRSQGEVIPTQFGRGYTYAVRERL
jgi:hypothetical protein